MNRNTRGRCRHEPCVTELSWGNSLLLLSMETAGGKIPVHNLSVVYAHPYLHELMETFMHLSSDDTIILWAMRFRLDPENSFVDTFEKHFHLEELYDLPSQIKLYLIY